MARIKIQDWTYFLRAVTMTFIDSEE